MPYFYLDAQNETATSEGFTRLNRVVVGTGAASAVLTVYDGTSTSDPVVAAVNAAAIDNADFGGLGLSNMHVALTGGNAKVTITYE